jgi:hypothetical protein
VKLIEVVEVVVVVEVVEATLTVEVVAVTIIHFLVSYNFQETIHSFHCTNRT